MMGIGGTVSAGDDGLVAYWSFDDGTAKDKAGNNDGTIHGAKVVDGISGKALKFDGKNDYIDCGNDASLDITGDEITMEAWIKPDVQEQNDYVINKDNSYGIAITGGVEGIRLKYYHTGATPFVFMPSYTVSTTEWSHYVVTYDGSHAISYINGDVVSSDLCTGNIISSPSPVEIARIYSGGGYVYYDGTIDEVKIYNRALTANEIKAEYEKHKPCTSGETKPCTAQNTCQGTQTCINEKWNDCTTTLKKCPTGNCKTTCVCEYEGQTRSCTASNDCLGTQTCSNEQWSNCETNLQKCPDGSCIPKTETCPCKEGETRGCTAPNECYGKEKCINGKWSDCTTDLKKNPDGSCTAPGKEGGNINPPHFSSKALDADDKNPGRIAVQVTNIMGNPNLDMQIIMDVPDNVEVSGSTNVLEGKSSYSTTIKGTGTRWIEIPFTAKKPGNYRISMLIYWKWEGSPEPLRQVGFDHTVYVDKKQGEITEEQKEPDNAGNGKQGEFPTSNQILLVLVVMLGLAVIIAVWKKPKFIFRHKE